MSLLSFNLAIDRFTEEEVPQAIATLARAVAITALNKVVLKSPVDTGRFRSAWMVTIGARTDAAPPRDASIKAGSRGKSGRGAAAAATALSEGVAVIAGAQPFQSIILQNNVEYAEELEDGSSTQAPRGIVRVTVAEIEAAFR